MRLSRSLAASLVSLVTGTAPIVLIATIAACSSERPQGTVDGSIDTAAGPVNALGQLCPVAIGGGGTDCPDGNTCKRINGIGTNMTTGYCTPSCMNSDAICRAGYTGPQGGVEKCSLGASATDLTGCAIECTAPAQCPTGLSCVMANASTMLCVPT